MSSSSFISSASSTLSSSRFALGATVALSTFVALKVFSSIGEKMQFPKGLLRRRRDVVTPPELAGDVPPLSPEEKAPSHLRMVSLSNGNVRVSDLFPPPSKWSGLTLVLIHGIATPLELWDAVASALYTDGHRVLRYDLYGRGYSDAPDLPNDVELFVGQLAELLYKLNVNDPIDLFGVSLGGGIAAAFTATFPHKVRRLLLFSSAGAKSPPLPSRWITNESFNQWMFQRVGAEKLVQWGTLQWNNPHTQAFETGKVRHFFAAKNHLGFMRSFYSTFKCFRYGAFEPIFKKAFESNPTRPTAIIWGEKDTLLTVDQANIIQSWIPNSDIYVVKNGNHMFLVEQPEETAEIIRDWYRKQGVEKK